MRALHFVRYPVWFARYRYRGDAAPEGNDLFYVGISAVDGAPITAVLTFIIGAILGQRRMKSEEAAMRLRFGEEYDAYKRETDAVIPAIW